MADQLMRKIRKQLPNYSLPSEAWEFLKGLVGKRISSIKVGVLSQSLENAIHGIGPGDMSIAQAASLDGPIFITVGDTTYVFQSDDFTFSLAVRVASYNIESQLLIEQLYLDDSYFPSYLRIRSVIDITQVFRVFTEQRIKAVKILKLSDNQSFVPVNGLNVSEVAVVLSFENAEDLLVAFRMGGVPCNGHCLLTWNLVSTKFPKSDLVCIREHPE